LGFDPFAILDRPDEGVALATDELRSID